jgi:hypothetical protein
MTMQSALPGFALCAAFALAGCSREPDIYGEPGVFHESAETPFFFSIDRNLHHGKSLNQDAPVLFTFTGGGVKTRVLPAPDQQKAVILDGDTLYLARPGKPTMSLLTKIWREGTPAQNSQYFSDWQREVEKYPVGSALYNWKSMQWDASSRYLYVQQYRRPEFVWRIEDESTLLRFDMEHPTLAPEVMGHKFLHFTLVGERSVCFFFDGAWRQCNTPEGMFQMNANEWGRIRLENGNSIGALDPDGLFYLEDNPQAIIPLENGKILRGPVFISYRPENQTTRFWLERHGFFFDRINGNQQALFSGQGDDRKILLTSRIAHRFTFADSSEDDGIHPYAGAVLPGGRYIFLRVFDKPILIDSIAAQYRYLPKDTWVHLNQNSQPPIDEDK